MLLDSLIPPLASLIVHSLGGGLILNILFALFVSSKIHRSVSIHTSMYDMRG